MDKQVKIYNLHDPQQYEDEREFWRNKSPEEKIEILESIRSTWFKLGKNNAKRKQRFRRVFRIIDKNTGAYIKKSEGPESP